MTTPSASPSLPQRKVLFVLMPWAGVQAGGLGIATLKAILSAEGIAADCFYPNIDFARLIGLDFYRFIGATGGSRYRGEIFFTPSYFNIPVDHFTTETLQPYYAYAIDLFRDVLGGTLRDTSERELLNRCRDLCVRDVPRFLTTIVDEIPWAEYDIVGFSLMFHQTLPSLCLAREIKRRFPRMTILFGGPSCAGEMGEEMLAAFPEIDVVATGESDEIIAPLIRTLRAGGDLALVPGVAFRRDGRTEVTPSASLLRDLDRLPIPDYTEYVAAVLKEPGIAPSLYFESSRGCWWGQKHLCTFCGLNAEGLSYRRKTAGRVYDEIVHYLRTYGVTKLVAADNIIDMSYFADLLPRLAELKRDDTFGPGRDLSIMYETKSNLKRPQVALLKAAGVDEIQPGIESFSDHVLSLMSKGATGLQQVQCIKWAAEQNVFLTYGVLYRNPGETIDDYDGMAAMVDVISHLPPPRYVTPMILDRFSPYFQEPDRHGIADIRPQSGDLTTFPDPRINLRRLAYHFDYDHASHHDDALRRAVDLCVQRLRAWRDKYVPDTLVYDLAGEDVIVADRRSGERRMYRLSGLHARVFRFFDAIHTPADLIRGMPADQADGIQRCIHSLLSRRWLLADSRGRYLCVAVRRSLAPFLQRPAPDRVDAAVAV